jgi:rsbT co-antagonist protein RsbR
MMADADDVIELPQLIDKNQGAIVAEWLQLLTAAAAVRAGTNRAEFEQQCRDFLAQLSRAIASGIGADVAAPTYGGVREMLGAMAQTRAAQGYSPAETATFVFSLKQPLFGMISRTFAGENEKILRASWTISQLLDKLGIYTIEAYQKVREQVIIRQQQEIAELSTPVVQVWDGVLALPVIGTLDSARTQVVMENLLQRIVDTGAEIAIIDITGVVTVDTLVAQHLLKTVAAARLMGADCIISGIRPQIAQTLVHLGVELNVVTKASLADALAEALRRTNRTVVTLSAKG